MMIILLRRWNGKFPSPDASKSTVWFGESSSNLTAWILSFSQLSWGYRGTEGYLGSGFIQGDDATYQWHCWTGETFARMAYTKNQKNVSKEKQICLLLTKELGLDVVDFPTHVQLEKDPAGLTVLDLESIILKKFQKESQDG